jgi:serine protease Do
MKKNIIVLVLVLALPAIFGGVIGYSIGKPRTGSAPPAAENVPDEASQIVPTAVRDSIDDQVGNSRRNAITRTVALACPAVVGINVTEVRQYRYRSPWGDDPFFRQFFGDRVYTEKVQGLGSGFLISDDGYILTNDHVAGNAKEITVTLTNGEKFKAELIGTDQVTDIALLKINGKDLPHLKLGNSDDVIIGEWVIALGNPFGLFDISDKPTVTVGVVSATQMNLRAEAGRVYKGMIQTDASINSGNSGGPLVNTVGEVVGVNAVIYTPNQGSIGLGFAIPINRVRSVISALRKHGKVEREFWTGLEVQAVDERVARYFGLAKAEGVIISDIAKGSPGDKAGFKLGDIITKVNGERVSDEASLLAILDDSRTGDTVKVQCLRDKKQVDLSLKLEKH